ncbi:MAG: hypothetical protein H6745_29830, partial [Deltaproteobacteria bacterium]|nr:hypothetical protein [Deltaproteobacteria bacterium]
MIGSWGISRLGECFARVAERDAMDAAWRKALAEGLGEALAGLGVRGLCVAFVGGDGDPLDGLVLLGDARSDRALL